MRNIPEGLRNKSGKWFRERFGYWMQFAKELYLSEGLLDKKRELILRLKHGKVKRQVYIIYFNRHSNTPEFINSIFLKQKYFKHYPMYVIGIVESYGQAMAYMSQLLKDAFLKNGNFNVKENVCRC